MFLVWLVECRWEIHYNQQNYPEVIAKISFNQFVRYYNLNPTAYILDGNDWCPHRKSSSGLHCDEHRIHFRNVFEHFRYRFWKKKELRRIEKEELERGQTAGTESYIRSVMEDVEAVRKKAAKEYDDAMSKLEASQKEADRRYQQVCNFQRKLVQETGLSFENVRDLAKIMAEAGQGGRQ